MSVFNTLFNDPMNGANENPLSFGGNWAEVYTGLYPAQILNNECTAVSGGEALMYYVGGKDFTADQFASCAVANLSETDGSAAISLYVRFKQSTQAGYYFYINYYSGQGAYLGELYSPSFSFLGSVYVDTLNVGDVLRLSAVGTTITVWRNGTSILTATDATSDLDGSVSFTLNYSTAVTDAAMTNFLAGSVSPYSISGNCGVAGATISNGTFSVSADASGNYTIGASNGTVTITPSLLNHSFSPTSQNVTVSGSNVTGVNFTDGVQYAPGTQPAQMFSADGSGHYCVIDNGGPGLQDGLNYDCVENGAEFSNIGTNFYPNQSEPDFIPRQRTVCAAPIVTFLNPA